MSEANLIKRIFTVALILLVSNWCLAQDRLKPYANRPLGRIWSGYQDVPTTGDSRRNLRPVDDMMIKFLVDHQLPGATLAIRKGRRLVYSRGFGYQDVENKLPMPPDARMRLASISKPITAAAILQLVDKGKLALDHKVFQHDLSTPREKINDLRMLDITVLQLLRHTAGFDRTSSFDPMFINRRVAKYLDKPTPVDPDDIIKYMLEQGTLDFDPGTKHAYSNFGYSVLGRVVEKASGMPYEEYVLEKVLNPLGIRNMAVGYSLPEKRLENEPRYYLRHGETTRSLFDSGSMVPHPYGRWSVQTMDAHGGWVGSAQELTKFAAAFNEPSRCPILSKEGVTAMFRPPDLDFFALKADKRGKKRFYGCGWNVLVFKNNKFNSYHGGLFSGTSAILVKRHDGFTWAVLFNCSKTSSDKTPSRVIDSLIHRAVNSVKKW